MSAPDPDASWFVCDVCGELLWLRADLARNRATVEHRSDTNHRFVWPEGVR